MVCVCACGWIYEREILGQAIIYLGAGIRIYRRMLDLTTHAL